MHVCVQVYVYVSVCVCVCVCVCVQVLYTSKNVKGSYTQCILVHRHKGV